MFIHTQHLNEIMPLQVIMLHPGAIENLKKFPSARYEKPPLESKRLLKQYSYCYCPWLIPRS